ncbi:crAss001_48 related protein [Megamonas hypermegale]|uniref:crAss001_48 related protein n=1 Tax=Megamonas hypermegale TaxID=158847 RepID=UPI0026EBC2F3|nr:hypothetical protein [Megamonas hypermegale]
MELKDTVDLMTSPDYKERFLAEYQQVKIRLEKLEAMLKKYKEGTLPFKPTCSYELLFTQCIYMRGYISILDERAKKEGINK